MFSRKQLNELKFQYDTQGYVHLKDVIPGALLKRLQRAFDTAAAPRIAAMEEPANAGKRFVDIPRLLDKDDAFIDLVDMEPLFPVLVALVGEDIQLIETVGRLFFPGKTFTAPFHSDLAHVRGFAHAHSVNFQAKAHYYVEDLQPDQGCLAFLPGSHRLPPDAEKPSAFLDQNSAAVVKIVPKAGDVIIFNTHLLHMALDNDSGRLRKSIIYSFSHFWMKQARSAVPSDLTQVATCFQRMQLFGIDDPQVPHFNRSLAQGNVGGNRIVAFARKVAGKVRVMGNK